MIQFSPVLDPFIKDSLSLIGKIVVTPSTLAVFPQQTLMAKIVCFSHISQSLPDSHFLLGSGPFPPPVPFT